MEKIENKNVVVIENDLDCLVPLEFKPEAKSYQGTFISKEWDTAMKDGQFEKKDLVIRVQLLNENDDNGKAFVIERRYNMLPRARGKNDLLKHFFAYLGCERVESFPKNILANLKQLDIVNKPVELQYKTSKKSEKIVELIGFKKPAVPKDLATPTSPVAPVAPVSTPAPAVNAPTA